LIIEIPACSGYLFETIKNLPVQVFEKKKKKSDSKERTTGSGSFKKVQRTARFHEGPGKEPVGLGGYLICVDNPVHHRGCLIRVYTGVMVKKKP
jgi:hypothetical protein